jgi:hypothetical protein
MTQDTKRIIAAWLSLLAALYATLLPFEFRTASLAGAWDTYTSLSFQWSRSFTPDARQQWVANALLFLPLGFFWTWHP